MGDIIPPRNVTEYLHAVEDAVDALEDKRPEEMFLVFKVSWYGEMYAELMEEGWTFITPGEKVEGL